MVCRVCGTEIADKALICYRCGTATTDAKYKPAASPRRSSASLIATFIAIALLALLAVFLTRTGPGESSRFVTAAVVVVAVLVVGLRAWARRR
jgi:hypothetical protein